MSQLRFIIAGTPRIASTWLTEVMRRVFGKAAEIHHEWFADDMLVALDCWASDIAVCGSVGQDHSWIEMIHGACADTKWVIGWRDPIEQVISMLFNRWSAIGRRSPQAIPGFAIKHASREWLALDWALGKAEQLGVELTHWHFDHYTTEPGVRALVQELGGEVAPDFELPAALNTSKKRPFALPPKAESELLKLFGSFPRLVAAYEAARRS